MGKRHTHIDERHAQFIARQKLFFVATAMRDGHINLSPKGLDTLRVLAPDRVAWLNVTGSGNETAAHLRDTNRLTLMFCAFDGDPLILRLYGRARVYHPRDAEWSALAGLFPVIPGARQIIDVAVELVQTSCGMGVPLFTYQGERGQLTAWAAHKGTDGIRRYWEEKNQTSLDGKPTGILD